MNTVASWLIICRWFYCRLETLTGAQCRCHWHLVSKILRGWTRQRAMLLGVLNTPAVRKNRTAPPRPPRTGWQGKGHWQWIHLLRRRCQRRAAKLRSVVDSSGSPRTTRRKRRPRPLWSEGRAVVRTSRRSLAAGRLVTPLPLKPNRHVLERQRRQRRPVGPGGGFLQRRTGAPICKLNKLSLTLPLIIIFYFLCCCGSF